MLSVTLTNLMDSIPCRILCLFVVFVAQARISLSVEIPELPEDGNWTLEAKKLVGELQHIVETTPEIDRASFLDKSKSLPDLWKNRAQCDKTLWRLWLITGMPPLPGEPKEPFVKFARRNAVAYQEYLDKNADRSLEEATRLGLRNCAGAFGSPYWYMAMKYISEKANVQFGYVLELHVTPHWTLKTASLSEKAYANLSAAYLQWLDANEKRMVWDRKRRQFRAQEGKYVGTNELCVAIVENAFPAAADMTRQYLTTDQKGAMTSRRDDQGEDDKDRKRGHR
jgi:hypothetical protein